MAEDCLRTLGEITEKQSKILEQVERTFDDLQNSTDDGFGGLDGFDSGSTDLWGF